MKHFAVIAMAMLGLAPAGAQQYGNNAVMVQVLTTSSTGVSGPLPNVGQSLHYFTVQNKDAPGQSCAGTYFVATLQASFDKINYFVVPQQIIGAGQSALGNQYTQRLYQATGAFPAYKIVLTTLDTVHCRYDAFYSGVVSSNTSSPLGITGIGSFSGLVANLNQLAVSKALAGDQVLINNGGNGGITDISVYAMTVCNAGTAGQTVILKFQGITVLKLPEMQPGQCYTSPISPTFPTLTSNLGGGVAAGQNLVLNLANATEVDFQLTFRYE